MSENVEVLPPIGGANGTATDMRRSFRSGGLSPLSDDQARGMLEDCMRFLWQIAMITSEVVGSIQVGAFRQIAAADCAAPGSVIGPDGREFKPVPEETRGPKGPRGARHPLMTLVNVGLSAVRLLRQLVRGVFPGAVGELSQLEKFDERLRLIHARADSKLFKI
jgi:hypothetical protein